MSKWVAELPPQSPPMENGKSVIHLLGCSEAQLPSLCCPRALVFSRHLHSATVMSTRGWRHPLWPPATCCLQPPIQQQNGKGHGAQVSPDTSQTGTPCGPFLVWLVSVSPAKPLGQSRKRTHRSRGPSLPHCPLLPPPLPPV